MKEFNKPNVKASRYRPQVNTILDKEFFENFKQAHPRYKDLDNKLIRKMIKRFIIETISNEKIYFFYLIIFYC